MENGIDSRAHGGDGHAPRSSTADEVKAADDCGTGHKRSLSGSILGRLPFLRASTSEDVTPMSPPKREDDTEQDADDGEGSRRSSSLSNALRQTQGRRRRGSLRKTAILGTGKLRERRNSLMNKASPTKQTILTTTQPAMGTLSPDEEATPRPFAYEHPSLNSSSDSGWDPSKKLSISTETTAQNPPRALTSPFTSPVGPYASTTDDDEGLSFYRPTISSSSSSYNPVQLQPPGSSALQRRRSNKAGHNSSLTIVHTPADLVLEEDWDYSETEWWGWVVLVVTWIVFVVGMGSCLGLWSWAWDVGETPYAPPELEDDPTLPITGYYPALMVCTAVMAWVWVVVAWVGMKYFRHAKVVGEDG